jgi:hypothetical protein
VGLNLANRSYNSPQVQAPHVPQPCNPTIAQAKAGSIFETIRKYLYLLLASTSDSSTKRRSMYKPHIEFIMDINLPDADFHAWTKQLNRYFSNLQETGDDFAPESMLRNRESNNAKKRQFSMTHYSKTFLPRMTRGNYG